MPDFQQLASYGKINFTCVNVALAYKYVCHVGKLAKKIKPNKQL